VIPCGPRSARRQRWRLGATRSALLMTRSCSASGSSIAKGGGAGLAALSIILRSQAHISGQPRRDVENAPWPGRVERTGSMRRPGEELQQCDIAATGRAGNSDLERAFSEQENG
jgi:hypothetical protein